MSTLTKRALKASSKWTREIRNRTGTVPYWGEWNNWVYNYIAKKSKEEAHAWLTRFDCKEG